MRRLLAAVAVTVTLLALAACGGSAPKNALGSRQIGVADRVAAPAMRGELMNGGGRFDLSQHKGQVVVVNFWASYCAPCRTEAPELEKVLAATKDQGVAFIGVNVHDQRDPANAYLADIKPTYGSIFDPSASLALEFDVPPNSIPATLVIDKAGRIAAVIRSEVDQRLLEPVVRDLLAERS
ncbi:TlpA family protein disulfide reductase [Dactylosporangium sp. NPDC048998]|uniref:TlpA family protein disulfide reductase n=1 Tax=Dactylosporangium sp. NPDC048998 TaxID=3363976 RepID=UPI00371BD1E2